MILDLFTTGGLPNLIDWRCNAAAQSRSFTIVRMEAVLTEYAAGLAPEVQAHLASLLRELIAAAQETGVPFPVLRLIKELPSSPYR